MSNNWSDGYFTEFGYTYGYYRELSPAFLKFCQLLAGYAPQDSDETNYCELGVGQGVSISIHAASNPGFFWGNDFNPGQIAFAQALAPQVNLPLSLSDDSFDEYLNADLPPMDYIALHGIWTWVSRDNQQKIVAFLKKFLKPGGLAYLSYNTYPGWAPAAPLRQIFSTYDRFAGRLQSGGDRIDSAIDFADRCLAANPAYLRACPGLKERLEKIKIQDKNYLAHEYFNREWNVAYFLDVADEMTKAKLEYVANGWLLNSIDAVNLSPEGSAFIKGIDNPLLREQMMDYFLGTQFRRDIYMRGGRSMSAPERSQRLMAQRFVLAAMPEGISRKLPGAYLTGNLQDEIYGPVLEALSANGYQAKSMQSICDLVVGQGVSPAQVLDALKILVGMGHVNPCHSERVAKAQKKVANSFNRALCEKAVLNAGIGFMAAPETGGAVAASRVQQLLWLAAQNKHPDPVRFAWSVFKGADEKLVKNGQPLMTEEENLAELREFAQTYFKQVMPLFVAHGIGS